MANGTNSDTFQAIVLTGLFTLGGAAIGALATIFQLSVTHADQTEATRAAHIKDFSEAMRESIPVLTQSSNDEARIICISSLLELAGAGDPNDKALRTAEETRVIAMTGSIKSDAVQEFLLRFLGTDQSYADILKSRAPTEYFALMNLQDARKLSAKAPSYSQESTPAPVAGISASYSVPASTVGWIYLGRGDYTSDGSIKQLIQPNSVAGNLVPLPATTTVLARDVHFRADEPRKNQRLAPIIGVLKSGQRVQVLSIQKYSYTKYSGEVWAHVQVSSG